LKGCFLRFLNNRDITDPRFNLALEEHCLRTLPLDTDYLLLYVNEPAVIIGRNQNALEEINHALVRERGIHVVRRISGGGAVYHDLGNLNYSFISRPDPEGIRNFRRFTSPVIRALRELGVEAGLCGRSDIVCNGRKISGNAQYTTGRGMITHGTLLYDTDLEMLVRSLSPVGGNIRSTGSKSVRSPVTNIITALDPPLSPARFRDHIAGALFAPFGGVREHPLTAADFAAARDLQRKKYNTWEWNFGKSPAFSITKEKGFSFGVLTVDIDVEKGGNIRNVKISGEIASCGDICDLEDRLAGVRYEPEALVSALRTLRFPRRAFPLTPEELAAFLY
jgi:lipoate-protein ligase A